VVLALYRMLPLARYSEPELDPVWVMLWCITVAFLLLVIVCLECPPPRRIVRWLNYLMNKCVISLLGLIFVSYLVSTYVGTLQLSTLIMFSTKTLCCDSMAWSSALETEFLNAKQSEVTTSKLNWSFLESEQPSWNEKQHILASRTYGSVCK